MKYVMTLEHCPNPDIGSLRGSGGYYSEPVDKKPIKAIGSSYKEMRDKFCDWIHRNDLGAGNIPWIIVSVIGKDKLIKPVARFSANGRLWELDDNDDSFNTSDPREICIDVELVWDCPNCGYEWDKPKKKWIEVGKCELCIDDDKETMDKYATGEIKAVEPEPVKPELSKSFNMCDECMETNETQDYSVPMYYNIEQNVFECLNGHTEDPINHFRQDSRDSLFDIVMGLLGANPSGTCQVYGRKNRPVKPEPVLATRHSDNEVIDVTLTEDEAFEEGFRQGKLTNDKPEPVKPPTNFDAVESLNFIWDKLHGYREDCIPESNPDYDEEWDDICTAMSWIEDECGVERKEGVLEPKPEHTGIISQLTESLDCDADEIVDIVNLLNMTEYWVENKMLDLCEDNDVMRKVLWTDFKEFIQKYKPQNLSVEELYVTDKSEEDK